MRFLTSFEHGIAPEIYGNRSFPTDFGRMILPQPWQSFRRSTCPWLPAGSTDWMTMVSPVRSPKSDTVAEFVTAGLGCNLARHWTSRSSESWGPQNQSHGGSWWLMMGNDVKWWLIIWLVVWTYPSEKWWTSSVGMMTWPQYDGKHNPNVPNHQPDQSSMNMAMARANRLWTYCDSLT